MKTGGKRIAIYSRKSKFTGKGESIGNQVELCREYVRNVFGEEKERQCVIFEDEGFSGGNLKRPDFRNMMEQVRQGKFRAIVVYRLDRISRNISDFAGLIDELTKLGVSFISIREQFDTGTPMGRAMMFIISVFSQLERETIAERIRDNMHELAKTGRWLGGNAPTGFRSESVTTVSVDGKTRKACRLAPVPEEAAIVRLIFDLYTEKDSLTAVEAELLRRRIKTRQGRDFSRFSIKAILQNPVYLKADENAYRYFLERQAQVCFPQEDFDGTRGIMAYNRTEQEKGKTTVLQPVSRWIIALGSHSGLVDADQWIRIQESLDRNKSGAYRKPRRNEALLTGLLYCACGERMYPKLSQRTTEDGISLYSYVCKRKERSRGACCRRGNVEGNALDAAVIGQIKNLREEYSSFADFLSQTSLRESGSRDTQQFQLTKLRREYAQGEKTLRGLMDALGMAEESAARARLLKHIEALDQTNRELEAQIRQMEAETTPDDPDDAQMDALRESMQEFGQCVENMSPEEKRAVLRTLVRRVTWDGKYAQVILLGAEGEVASQSEGQTHWCEDSK